MKGKLGYIFLFLLILVVSVIAHIPASWVIERYAPKNVEIAGVSGTIWQGDAQYVNVITSPNIPTISLGKFYWSFSPMQLFSGRAEYALRFGQNSQIRLMGDGNAGIGLSGAYLRNTQVSMPAEEIINFIEIPVPTEVEGHVELNVASWLHKEPLCQQGNATARWLPAKVTTLDTELDVNTVESIISCDGQAIDIATTQSGRQFSSKIDIRLNEQYQYNLEAWLKPDRSFPKAMLHGLNMVVALDEQGRYPYKMSGRL